jgi:paraquat-inducible protein A
MDTVTAIEHTHPQQTPDMLIACIDCDQLYRKPQLHAGEKALCANCGAALCERKRGGLDLTLALACTCLILLLLANIYPLLRMTIAGRVQEATLMTGIVEMYSQGYGAVALLVFIVTILAPLSRILLLFYVLIPMRFNRYMPKATHVFRWLETLSPWAMTEVFMLGILVAVVKLADLATLQPGIAVYSFASLMLFVAATDASLDEDKVWEKLGAAS